MEPGPEASLLTMLTEECLQDSGRRGSRNLTFSFYVSHCSISLTSPMREIYPTFPIGKGRIQVSLQVPCGDNTNSITVTRNITLGVNNSRNRQCLFAREQKLPQKHLSYRSCSPLFVLVPPSW